MLSWAAWESQQHFPDEAPRFFTATFAEASPPSFKMEDKQEKIQRAQEIAGLLDTVNNTSLKKHPKSAAARLESRHDLAR